MPSPLPPEVAAQPHGLTADEMSEMAELEKECADPGGDRPSSPPARKLRRLAELSARWHDATPSPPAPVEDDGLDEYLDDESWDSLRVTTWLRELQARRRGER